MKTYTIEISNIDYSGNDFCGEITGEEAVKIFDAQPKVLTISFDLTDDEVKEWNHRAELGESDDWLIDDIVSDYASDKNILWPTTYDYSFVK